MTANYQNTAALETIVESLGPLRAQIMNHELYGEITTIEDVRVLMEHHIFAVWDFMSLLKALQIKLTCTQVPWVPQGNPLVRRLINEIVLAEESDDIPGKGYTSHFELYRKSMLQCGADTTSIDMFTQAIMAGSPISGAVKVANVPPAARQFLLSTWDIIESDSTHCMAASLTLGREDIIPDMFKKMICDLHTRFPGRLDNFKDYLERHIEVDADQHRPMSFQMLDILCDTGTKWREVETAAQLSLKARVLLWDGVRRGLRSGSGGFSRIYSDE